VPKPFFSHSFTIAVFNADSAVITEHKSDKVCLLLEKSNSTEILTHGIAGPSQVRRVSTRKSATCTQRALQKQQYHLAIGLNMGAGKPLYHSIAGMYG
jgi:hypothetical protein